ncbi:CRISPR-associated endonuclease Cas3'' [Faucicola atlantae]|uniref:CRISPR-associated endonuclease Cas3'' n=1 Tax=Faucicola atlantae TaxID=34059 RepID=UPI0025B2252D|nr:CRISPR-associated endonuclease Cas3'' [Moraxella atlantae]
MTLSPNQKQYIAHVRKSDGAKQSLLDHLTGTAELAKQFANKIGLPLSGELIGLVHDLGKYSDDFQIYIKSATGIFNPDIDDEYVDAKGLKGKIDHSTAGGQWLIESLKNFNHPIKDGKTRENGDLLAQILGLCVVSHHSGLIDIVDLSETAILKKG